MDKLFVDTNVFESKGFNFDSNNILIKVMLNNIKNKKYEYCNLSVIDNEIISHIRLKSQEDNHLLIKKFKWIKDYVSEEDIYNNCYKNLIDYQNFKRSIKSVNCNVSKIDAELVFQKYFSIELPFENKAEKRKEFPDAFIAEYINELNTQKDTIHFVSKDKGLCKSLNDKVLKYDSIEEFLTKINGVDPSNYSLIIDIVSDNLNEISKNIFKLLRVESNGIEDYEIEPDNIVLSDDFNLEIMDFADDEFYVNCSFSKLSLYGYFSCLDYDNSYCPYDYNQYSFLQYLSTNLIEFDNYEVALKLKKKNDKWILDYDNYYYINIDYEKMKKFANDYYDPLNYYDGEDSWAQDGGRR